MSEDLGKIVEAAAEQDRRRAPPLKFADEVEVPRPPERTSCSMPEPCDPAEAAAWRSIRDLLVCAHCVAGRAHACCGEITISARAVTFSCPLCGDARETIVEGGAP